MHGVSRGNADLAVRPPVIVATVDGFLFGPGLGWQPENGSERAVCGCAAAPLAGAFGMSWGYRAPICLRPNTVSIVAGSGG